MLIVAAIFSVVESISFRSTDPGPVLVLASLFDPVQESVEVSVTVINTKVVSQVRARIKRAYLFCKKKSQKCETDEISGFVMAHARKAVFCDLRLMLGVSGSSTHVPAFACWH